MSLDIEKGSNWSQAIFGACDLGDKRLTQRLVQIGKQLSEESNISLAKSCAGSDALIEGSYRFIRNQRITAAQIACGGYEATARLAQTVPLLLAIEDSTSLAYEHSVRNKLGLTSNNVNAKKRGYIVHSTLLLDANQEKTLGLITQERWCRDPATYGKSHDRRKKDYVEKESYKWEKNSQELSNSLRL